MHYVLLAGSYTSCNKMEKKNNTVAENVQLKAISGKLAFTDYPTVENGMLKFRDDDHYGAYMQFLDKAIEGIDSTDTVNDEHTVLQKIESRLKFESLRNTTHAAYETQNAIGFNSLEAASDEHFITAADIRSTLNSDLNVRIGNEIMHYINKDFAVRVGVDKTGILRQYMSLEERATEDNILAIDENWQNSKIYELSGDCRIFSGKEMEPLGPNDYYLRLPSYQIPDRCENPYRVRFTNMKLLKGQTKVAGYFKISYGDNSPEETRAENVAGISEFYHPYSSPGTYIVTIKGCKNQYFNPNETKTRTMEVVVAGGYNCVAIYKESGWRYKEYKSNYYLGGKLVTESTSNSGLRVVAYTKLVKQTSPGIYKGFKGNLTTTMHGEAKEINCSFHHYVDGSVTSNSKNQTLHRTPGAAANNIGQSTSYWSLYTSTHKLNDNGSNHWITISLTPCD